LVWIKNITHLLIDPLNIFWGLMIMYLYQKLWKKSMSNRFLFLSLGWLLLTSTSWLPNQLVYRLERQYDALTVHEIALIKNDTMDVIVLGGGGVADRSLVGVQQLNRTSLARLCEGVRIMEKCKYARLICSGYSASRDITQAELTRSAAIDLGVDSARIVVMPEPTTTEEEAYFYKRKHGTENRELIVVTSDIHMPRAKKLFELQGIKLLVSTADPIIKVNKEVKWSSDYSNFSKVSSALHEYLGLLWMRIENLFL
jgi:uncharacterized SAM-binding protein YcdF (DUF218 family)